MKKIIFLIIFFFFTNDSLLPQSDSTLIPILNNQDTFFVSLDSTFVSFTNPNKNSNWVEFTIPIIVAIFGGIIAISQVKMNLIKSARINWIENLRVNLSHFISSTQNVEHILDLLRADVDSGLDPDDVFKEHSKDLISAFNESMMYGTKIKLYLNILEKNHKELANKIDDYITLATAKFDQKDKTKTKNKIVSLTKEIISLSQKILKFEWDRVSKSWVKRKFANKNA